MAIKVYYATGILCLMLVNYMDGILETTKLIYLS
jgi:hypothetical protein